MATSDILTTEDIDDLSTAIQLKPHQKDVEFTTVTKSEEGDLVSLDELYEKTGQEAIGKIIDGFNELLKNNRLKKEHGTLLMVDGAESWMELPDRMNAIKGGEGFISKLSQAFVKIVREIIRFIIGVCNWIYVRVKALTGFARTREEVSFLYNRTEEIKKSVVGLFEILDIHGFNTDDLIKELPDGFTRKQMLTIVKNKLTSAGDVLSNLPAVENTIKHFYIKAKSAEGNIAEAKKNYNNIITFIKKALSLGHMESKELMGIKYDFAQIASQLLNPTPFLESYFELANQFYGISIDGLGVDKNLNAVKEKIKNSCETIKVNFDAELFEQTAAGVRIFNEAMDNGGNKQLGPKAIDYLKGFINENDSALVNGIAALTQDPDIERVYLEFCQSLKTYTSAIESILEIVQRVDNTVASLTKLNSKLTMLVISHATENIEIINKAHDELTEEELNKLKGIEGSLFNFKSLDRIFYEKHPNGHIEKYISDNMNAFFKTSRGKSILKSLSNFLSRYKAG